MKFKGEYITSEEYNRRLNKEIKDSVASKLAKEEKFTFLDIAIEVYNKGFGTIRQNKILIEQMIDTGEITL